MSPEWIGGRNAIREALLTGVPLEKLIIARGAHGTPIDELRLLASQQGVRVDDAERPVLDRQIRDNQGVIASMRTTRPLNLGDIRTLLANPGPHDRVLVLDSIQDPGNVGALVRTAAATGVRAVIMPEHRAAGVTATVIKASAGTALHLPMAQVPNLRQAIQSLKELGFWSIGLDGHARDEFDKANLSGPVAIVVGAEGRGLGDLVRRECDILVRLPIVEAVESLNASVAGSILLYHLYRQMRTE
jgi:23S rRNA (guanosine2251-2'-O)-methyltransferase